MKCPRDADELQRETLHGIEVDACHTCRGLWLDTNELDQLEAATASTEEERRATVVYGERKSELKCPVDGKQMIVFNYRAHAVEIDMCEEHGWWLDAGEEGRVREIIEERVRDLGRKYSAESAFGRFLGGAFKRGKRR
jgi:Zn-finger nucleic acid-binding protein